MIRLEDLEGVAALEWEVTEQGWTRRLVARAHKLARKHFGLAAPEAWPTPFEDGSVNVAGVRYLPSVAEDKIDQYEEGFEVLHSYMWHEAEEFWASVGWDVSDHNGRPLQVLAHLGYPLLVAIKQRHPKANLNIAAASWGARLEDEASKWRRRNPTESEDQA